MNTGGSAFSQTFQHITATKLHELERQRETCIKYAEDTFILSQALEDPVSRFDVLLKRIRGWPGTGSVLLQEDLDYDTWLQQARHDPSISSDQVLQRISKLELELKQAITRYDYAKLFGDLLKEWLQSGDSLATLGTESTSDELPTQAKTHRAERGEQVDRLQELIFEAKRVDVAAIEAYLADLFSSPDAATALDTLRSRISKFSPRFQPKDMRPLVSSLLSEDLLSPEKAAIVKSFLDNEVFLTEVGSVLDMQLARIDEWDWPEEGVFVEMRRQLSGKYRAYMDTEIIQALLFQYIGMKWSMQFKAAFKEVTASKAWKSEIPPLTMNQLARRRHFRADDLDSGGAEDLHTHVMNRRSVGRGRGRGRGSGVTGRGGHANAPIVTAAPVIGSIQAQRRDVQLGQFFLTQLPDTFESVASYDEQPAVNQVKSDPAVSPQQVLLRLISTEAHLKRTLYGSCTIIRADLEWFGPSIPHDSILTVLRFFGMPDKWVQWLKKWLAAKLRFDDSPEVRVRQRGVPVAQVLSTLCGEALLFGMDFAVNQRAQGLFLHRMFDDFWMVSHSGKLCADAWAEMEKYASLVGISFNAKKTGSACVGGELEPSLPRGVVSWGFLVFDQQGRFAINQEAVDLHILELKRQLEKPKSVFGYVNALNKYMEFFSRNFGQPANCYGQVHVDEIVQTFARIQRAVFKDYNGSVVDKLRSMIEARFGIKNIPAGWCFFDVSKGGLGVFNPIVDPLEIRESLVSSPNHEFRIRMKLDEEKYEDAKAKWMNRAGEDSTSGIKEKSFMPFEEYILGREDRLAYWGSEWKRMQEVAVALGYPYYEGIWAFYREEIMAYFNRDQIVEPTLIPVGMLSTFRTAKIAWDS